MASRIGEFFNTSYQRLKAAEDKYKIAALALAVIGMVVTIVSVASIFPTYSVITPIMLIVGIFSALVISALALAIIEDRPKQG